MGKLIPRAKNLATVNPRLASEWHPTKNGDLTPSMVTASSNKKVHWLGRCGHEWEAKIVSRRQGSGCPICANRAVLAGYNDLATTNPDLASEWHPTKNGDLTPDMVTSGSHKKVHWLSQCGHEWEAVIGSRQYGSGCPICANQAVLSGYNDLTTTNPDLASEWHPTKNGRLTPDMVAACSNKKVHWLGRCGHEWKAKIEDRHYGTGCPICANKVVLLGYNDLATANPALASEWHPTKNGDLTPGMVTAYSEKRVHWQGCCGHEWIASIYSRHNGSGCPICANKVVLPGYNDLATVNPALASEWHPTKNGDLTPDMVTACSHKKVYWLGNCGHEWEAKIEVRQYGNGCPICANRAVLPGYNDLATVNPALASQWHPVKNGNLTPDMVTVNSHKRVHWKGLCGHEWIAGIKNRQHGSGCPFCANRVVLPGYNDLATVNPALASQWHPVKNGNLTPDMVTVNSHKKVHWLGRCGHEWEAIIQSRQRGSGCPICANKVVLRNVNDLASVNPALASEWHPTKNGNLTPDMVTANSHKKVYWLGNCGHEWEAKIEDRQYGNGCPICNGRIQYKKKYNYLGGVL